jgi:hypothetical protein
MKRTWCVVDGVFEKDNSLWWLNRNRTEITEPSKTPMIVALKNGGISRVIDVKGGGLANLNKRQGIF